MQCIFLFLGLGSGTGGSFFFCSPLGALLLGLVAQQFIHPLLKGEALAVLIRMLKSVYFFLFLASSSIRAIWSSGVVQVPKVTVLAP
jgi:hypothetical protein